MIDFSARERHFVDHLAPVWHAIPAEHRGTFYVDGATVGHARARGIDAVDGWPIRHRAGGGPIVCASWGDLRVSQRTGRKTVLFEHGSGQTYRNRHTSYAGGKGRDRVSLLLCPNEHSAGRNRRRYPMIPVEVIGSPRVDELRALPGPPADARPTVALSFHWRCEVAPETYSAIDHYAPIFSSLRADLEADGIDLLAHAHPRILDEARPLYDAAGIEVVDDFADIVARAHVYAVDNSSTLFEFAALDRPVVVLNAPHFRRDVDLGLRFWRDAVVGVNVDRAGDLADGFRIALEDPPDVARLRYEAIERVYPLRDGTSARRAASAIVALVTGRRPCFVCGSPSCSCGQATTVYYSERRTSTMKNKRYPNPAKPGAFLKLSDKDAKRLGLTGQAVTVGSDVTNPGATGPVTSTPTEDAPPKGAMKKGGPTARARAEAAAKAAPEVETGEAAPEVETGEGDDLTAETKKRPAPSSRRRRRPANSKG